MRRTTTALLAAGALVVLSAGGTAAAAAPVGRLDSTCNPGGPFGYAVFHDNYYVAQTFVAVNTAPVQSAKLIGLHRQPGGSGGPVVVEVRTTDGGAPTTTVLASAEIPAAEIPTTAVLYGAVVDFAPWPAGTLTAGQTYALVVRTSDSAQNGWNVGENAGCAGQLWQSTDDQWGTLGTWDAAYEMYLGAANDAFADSVPLPGTSADVAGTTFGATRETDEPDHYVMNVGGDIDWVGDHSVWYRWRSLGTGPVSLDTCAANIDSIVAVYTGGTVSGLTRVTDGNNDCPSGFGTALAFGATAGTTYRIAVADAGGGRESTFDLHLVGPPNESPTVTQLRPRDGATISDRTPTIAATVRDSATNLAAGNIVLRVDGTIRSGFGYDRGTDRLTFTTRQLGVGEHTVRVRAVDAQGAATVRYWSFRIA